MRNILKNQILFISFFLLLAATVLVYLYNTQQVEGLICLIFFIVLAFFAIVHLVSINKIKKDLRTNIQKDDTSCEPPLTKCSPENTFSQISSLLSISGNADEKTNEALSLLGQLCSADRAFVFKFKLSRRFIDNTHEWCSEGIKSRKTGFRTFEEANYAWLTDIVCNDEIINITDLDKIPAQAEAEKKLFQDYDTKSFLIVPFKVEGTVFGFVGFDSVNRKREWNTTDIEALRTFGNILGMALKKETVIEELNVEREQLLSVFDSIEEPIYVSDPYTHEVLYVNNYFKNLYKEDVIGKKCYKALQNKDKPCDFCTNSIILRNKNKTHRWEYQNYITNKDFLIMDRIVKWIDGRDVRFEIAHDITDIRKAKEALFLDESCLDTLHELSRMNILSVGKITSFALSEGIKLTKSHIGILGFFDKKGRMQIIDTYPESLFPLNGISQEMFLSLGRNTNMWIELYEEKKTVIVNNPLKELDNDDVILVDKLSMHSILAVPVINENEVVGFVGVANKETDYTAYDSRQLTLISQMMAGMILLKQSEDELTNSNKKLRDINLEISRANEELHSLDELKNNFLSTISHELKTPLISIMGFSELVCDESLGSLNKEQKRAMDFVNTNTAQLKRLIESLIFMSSLGAKNYSYDFSDVVIKSIIEKSLSIISIENKDKKISVDNRLPDDLYFIKGDMDYLCELFIHIIDNAFKFTPSEGKIIIHGSNEENNVHIIIEDTGIGIPETKIMKTFDSFYQLDNSLSRRYGGAGIGLNICKRITEDHGSKLWIESIEGAGTKVHVTFPAKRKEFLINPSESS